MRGAEQDTIAAIATPPGVGGIAVIRVSGPAAIGLTAKGFSGSRRLSECESHTAHFGNFVAPSGEMIDEVVALVFRAPHSYTGENTVEISCHGGPLVTRRVLEAVLQYGARLAQPGEFTKRAFLNGRIDLSQAEAVADLIHSQSDASLRASVQQLKGMLSEEINRVRTKLVDALGLLELELDFVEEDIEFVDKEKLLALIENARAQLQQLAATFRHGRLMREGVKAVLVGAPNVGKSSILNCLLNEQRAIVTAIPGTTRDVIEEGIILNGMLFRLVDTAGLRKTTDPVEREGVRRTEEQTRGSNVVLLVLDRSRKLGMDEVGEIERVIDISRRAGAQSVVVLNKGDLPPALNGMFEESAPFLQGLPTVTVSALTGEGMENLIKVLTHMADESTTFTADSSVTVTNVRHFEAISGAADALHLAAESLSSGQSGEFVAIDLRRALERLGEVIGTVTTDDILDSIFSKFCIGK